MLILPLHKKLGAGNFPVVTLLLVLANVFVFAFLQAGDDGVRERAAEHWQRSGVAALELPAFTAHLRQKGLADVAKAIDELDGPAMRGQVLSLLQADTEFVARLRAGEIITAKHPEYARWRAGRERVDAIWSESFTENHLLRYDDVTAKRLASSMFLHGDIGHLVGNMLFLVLLGVSVEGAFGPWLFLAVYLLGGLGGSLLSVVRHLGEPGGALGASGAIAALMGAYCVVWGLRKVRFFYWAFVVFDYVRAPALLLLPLWLGWELYNMLANGDAGIGFDAHAGGIMSGALLAFVVRKLGWERRTFLDEDERREAHSTLRAQALDLFGKLELAKARPLLAQLAAQEPQDFSVRVMLYRSWRGEPQREEFHEAGRGLLLHPTKALPDIGRQRELFADYLAASGNKPRLAAGEVLQLARRWIAIGALDEAEKMLAAVAARDASLQPLPDAWFELALARQQRQQGDAFRRTLQELIRRHPDSPPARKAGFLLANG